MLDKFKEFRDTLAERIKSPFVGSFMITWTILHWQIPVLLIYNEDNFSISARIDKLQDYLTNHSTWSLFVWPIILTLLVLISYNFLNAIGLGIKLLYDNWASPYIQKVFKNENIIERSKYDRLKKDFTDIKREYSEYREQYVSSEKQLIDISNEYYTYKENSIPGRAVTLMSEIFDPQSQWEFVQVNNQGRTFVDPMRPLKAGYELNNKKLFHINNALMTENFALFDKVIDNENVKTVLVRGSNGNYYGFQGKFGNYVEYRKRSAEINIDSAKYFWNNNYIDVTRLVQNLVNKNIKEFEVSNEIMGGDPANGEIKKLEIVYQLNRQEKTITQEEHKKIKIE